MLNYNEIDVLKDTCNELVEPLNELLEQMIYEYEQYIKCGTPEDCMQRKEWMEMSYEDIRKNFNDTIKALQREVTNIREEANAEIIAKTSSRRKRTRKMKLGPVNEYLKKNYRADLINGYDIPCVTKRMICNDGFSISVQANRYTYCTPRQDRAWPYSEVELEFPSELDELIEEYAETEGTTQTVFGYVPIKVVNQLIEKHGGIKE